MVALISQLSLRKGKKLYIKKDAEKGEQSWKLKRISKVSYVSANSLDGCLFHLYNELYALR
jgi:hypothetical protein